MGELLRLATSLAAHRSPRLRQAVYHTGALHVYHRGRNRRHLTVVMFHRVLAPNDIRWPMSDSDYTISQDLLAQCLEFFARHYHVVSLEQVLRARQGKEKLPTRALLITFDDGWADTQEYALSVLKRHQMPAVLFAASQAINRQTPFWQESVVAAWNARRLTKTLLQNLYQQTIALALPKPPFEPTWEKLSDVRLLISQMEKLDPKRRAPLIEQLQQAFVPSEQAEMMTDAQLRQWYQNGYSIGSHGQSHEPLTQVDNVDAELGGSRKALANFLLGSEHSIRAVSFPHGRYRPSTVQACLRAGYELCFSSDPVLNAVSDLKQSHVLGRLALDKAVMTDAKGNFSPERLALYLFRRPVRRLM